MGGHRVREREKVAGGEGVENGGEKMYWRHGTGVVYAYLCRAGLLPFGSSARSDPNNCNAPCLGTRVLQLSLPDKTTRRHEEPPRGGPV